MVFNGIFSINSVYHATVVSNMPFRGTGQKKADHNTNNIPFGALTLLVGRQSLDKY